MTKTQLSSFGLASRAILPVFRFKQEEQQLMHPAGGQGRSAMARVVPTDHLVLLNVRISNEPTTVLACFTPGPNHLRYISCAGHQPDNYVGGLEFVGGYSFEIFYRDFYGVNLCGLYRPHSLPTRCPCCAEHAPSTTFLCWKCYGTGVVMAVEPQAV